MTAAAIFGLSGQTITAAEAAFFRSVKPYGYILFRRNCETAEQVRNLTASLRDLSGRNIPILIDHEGGRVGGRLSPHIVPERPAAGRIANLVRTLGFDKAKEAAFLHGQILALDCASVGVSVDCVPLADVPEEGAHDIIGDRAFGREPETVAALARAQSNGLTTGGCLPVLKHLPGHGRAQCDSHLDLPTVDVAVEDLAACDFAAFAPLNDLPYGMTAHIVFPAIDPGRPATLSPEVIETVIRQRIGFDGMLMTDDLSMKALTGAFADRAKESLAAGCDLVLHCNGDMSEMRQVADGVSDLSDAAKVRANRIEPPAPADADVAELAARLDDILAQGEAV